MLKKLAALFCPSSEKLAKQSAAKIKDGVNGQSDETAATIAKYATLSSELSATAKTLSDILKDGKVDDIEESTLAEMMTPLFQKAKDIVGI